MGVLKWLFFAVWGDYVWPRAYGPAKHSRRRGGCAPPAPPRHGQVHGWWGVGSWGVGIGGGGVGGPFKLHARGSN